MEAVNMKSFARLAAFLLCSTMLWPAPAAADARGEELIAKLDKIMTLADDQFFVYDLVTKIPGKEERKQVMQVYVKGTKRRLVEYLAPADIKGMKVLVLAKDKMYVYLPAYRKVRRVASHAKNQGFMGTTFSHDDISTATYGPYYKGKLLRETDTHWTVEITAREGVNVPYSKLELDMTKKYYHPSQLRYYNKKGVKIKTEYRSGFACIGTVCNAGVMKMVDHVRNDAWTQMTRTKWKVNTGVSDRKFTLRALQRGR
jgi:outer membrane lipoprotein-sorting protein